MEYKSWKQAQMSLTDGALKALAKNVAVHVSLSRTTLKRVVARVVAERHGLGHMGDYQGHLFYVKPERIDMTDLISQAKEAMDEMLQQRREREQQKCGRHANLRSALTQFKLQAAGRSSLSGVIIDETHLPRDGGSIMELQSQQRHKRAALKPSAQQISKSKKQQSAALTLADKKLRELNSAAHQLEPSKRSPQQPRRLSKAKNKLSRKLLTTATRTAADMAYGHTSPVKKAAGKNRRLSAGGDHKKRQAGQHKQLYAKPKRSYDKPWLCYLHGRSSKREPQPAQSWRQQGQHRLQHERQVQRSGITSRLPQDKQHWYTPYQFREPRNCQPLGLPSKAKVNAPGGNRRSPSVVSGGRRRNKLLNERLIQDLQREEAIDEINHDSDASNELTKAAIEEKKVAQRRRRRNPGRANSRINRLAMSTRPSPQAVPIRGTTPPQKRKLRRCRRSACVAVDSSLGSFEAMRPRNMQNGTSQSLLTPAKRHLTIAFMDKRHDETRNHRGPVAWK